MQLKRTVYVSQLPVSEDQKIYRENPIKSFLFLKAQWMVLFYFKIL